MTDQPRASVVGNALMSFFPDIRKEVRERVQMAMLFAQRATQDALDNQLVGDGYSFYRRQLMFLGWDAKSPRESFDPNLQRRKALNDVLGQINASADSQYSDMTRWSIEALQASEAALYRFEARSLASESFQLLPCRMIKPGYVDLVLYHETLEREEQLSGFLYRERVVTGSRIELVRFNVRLFEQKFGAWIEKSLEQALRQDVYEL
ncbi:hypothetical protein [Pseudomonas sp. Marseille-P9899]|uniref:hypothetical protein n=1 Tax=Pseudomonas sp. Marseille-P9899 TaxID=2730401 RepID=UPI001588AE17|nr:hypothetical protein [Pseudomonas sp. Marseille-P9899]